MDHKKLGAGFVFLMLIIGAAACDRQGPTDGGTADESAMQRSDESRDTSPSGDAGGAPGAMGGGPSGTTEESAPNGGSNP